MTRESVATAFITGAARIHRHGTGQGLSSARGHEVLGLAPSAEAAERVRLAGAVPVHGRPARTRSVAGRGGGRLGVPPSTAPGVGTRASPDAGRGHRTRARVDGRAPAGRGGGRHDAADRVHRRHVLLRRGGTRAITEDEPPRPSALGRCLAPALDRVDGYIVAGLPIVTALPAGCTATPRGFASRVIEPVDGRPPRAAVRQDRAVGVAHPRRGLRPRAGAPRRARRGGGRYFLVDNDPVRMHEFARTFARLANRPLRVGGCPRRRPDSWSVRCWRDVLLADAVFSNIRLRGIGFRFRYPDARTGSSSRSSERSMSNTLRRPVPAPAMGESFDDVVLPHLDAAYRLARWLMRNEHDAEDVVQEASLRALRYFRTFHRRQRPRLVSQDRSQHLFWLARPQRPGGHRPVRRRAPQQRVGRRPIRKRCCCTPMTRR